MGSHSVPACFTQTISHWGSPFSQNRERPPAGSVARRRRFVRYRRPTGHAEVSWIPLVRLEIIFVELPFQRRREFTQAPRCAASIALSSREQRLCRVVREERRNVTGENDADLSANAELSAESGEVSATESCPAWASKREQRKAMKPDL